MTKVSEQTHFGDVLQAFMKSKKRSDGKLAELSGVPKHTIVSWRQGRTKRPKYADQIFLVAKALELDEEEANQLLASARHTTLSEHISHFQHLIVENLSLQPERAQALLTEATLGDE
ncbi:MAG: helix-turn-helix transcriptional regulator, partial [Chloroflexota bacterium]